MIYTNGLNVYKTANTARKRAYLETLGFFPVEQENGLQVAVTVKSEAEDAPTPEIPTGDVPDFKWSEQSEFFFRGKPVLAMRAKHEFVDYYNELGLNHPQGKNGKGPTAADYKADLAKIIAKRHRELKKEKERAKK